MSHTNELAGFASALAIEDIPEDVRRMARVCLLDTVGIILAGHEFLLQEGETQLEEYLKLVGGGEESTALGYRRRTRMLEAAFIGGCLVEVLDWQDTTYPARLHSASGTIPAVLAVAERYRLSGSQLITAIAAGYEVGARVGVAIQPSHWYGGFQATGTVGAIGAAAAVGSLLGFDAEEMTRGLGVAGHIAPISNGDGVFHGAGSKLLHGGMAAQTGVQSALLARVGFGAGPLEGLPPRHHGFMNISSEEMEPETLSRDLGSEWLYRDCSHKAYPVGLLNIGPVEVTLDLVAEHDIRPEQVEAVDATSYFRRPPLHRQELHKHRKRVLRLRTFVTIHRRRCHLRPHLRASPAHRRANQRSCGPRNSGERAGPCRRGDGRHRTDGLARSRGHRLVGRAACGQAAGQGDRLPQPTHD